MKRNGSILFILIFLFSTILYSGCSTRYEFESKSALPKTYETASSLPSATESQPASSNNVSENPEVSSGPEESQKPSPKTSEQPRPSVSPSALPSREAINEDFAKLAPTTRMSFAELVGDNGDYRKPDGYPSAGTYKIVVNIHYQVIMVYKKDNDGNYTVPVRYMICSSGSHEKPTPTGSFKMGSTRHRFSEFKEFKVFGQYWTQVTGSIYFHSLLYTKKNAKTYTRSSYRNLGRRVSHGCIRMLVPDARWIYYNAAPGTVVKIVKGKKDEKVAAIKKQLKRPKAPSKRPNLKQGKIPVTEPWPGYAK